MGGSPGDQWRMVGSKFGEATMWGGIVLHVYIKYKYSNYYLYSKMTRRSFFFENVSINPSCHMDWLSSFLRIPFQLINKPVLRAVLVSWNSSKKFLYYSNAEGIFPRKLFASRNQTDWPPYIVSVLIIMRDQTSFLIGWTAVVMVTE